MRRVLDDTHIFVIQNNSIIVNAFFILEDPMADTTVINEMDSAYESET